MGIKLKPRPRPKRKPLGCGDVVCCGKRNNFLNNSGVKWCGCYYSIGILLLIAIGFGVWGLATIINPGREPSGVRNEPFGIFADGVSVTEDELRDLITEGTQVLRVTLLRYNGEL